MNQDFNKLNFNFNSQAHLLIGNYEKSKNFIFDILQKIFCKKNVCNICIQCIQIKKNNHPSILFLEPEKQYNVEQIDLVANKLMHKLENNEYFFIIFNKADALTQATSNRLLKLVEEPSRGYYFIFMAQRKDTILPTIRSRCVLSYSDFENAEFFDEKNSIISFFKNQNFDSLTFLKTLDKANINEKECFEMIDYLIYFWSTKCKNYLLNKNYEEYKSSYNILCILQKSFLNPPMPGSSKIFLKNLFLNLQNIFNNN